MGDFSAVDPLLMPWAKARGLHVYTGHKQNAVRSITVYVWLGARHDSLGHIWLDAPNELGLVGVHAAHGAFRLDEAVPPGRLGEELDRVYDLLAAETMRANA